MRKKKLSPIEEAKLMADAAENAAAVGEEFALDYEIVNGAKLFYKTVAHDWIMAKLALPPYDKADQIEQSVYVVFLLSFDSKTVRNEGCALLRTPKKFSAAAWDFVERYSLSPESVENVLPRLIGHPYAAPASDKETTFDPTSANITTGQK